MIHQDINFCASTRAVDERQRIGKFTDDDRLSSLFPDAPQSQNSTHHHQQEQQQQQQQRQHYSPPQQRHKKQQQQQQEFRHPQSPQEILSIKGNSKTKMNHSSYHVDIPLETLNEEVSVKPEYDFGNLMNQLFPQTDSELEQVAATKTTTSAVFPMKKNNNKDDPLRKCIQVPSDQYFLNPTNQCISGITHDVSLWEAAKQQQQQQPQEYVLGGRDNENEEEIDIQDDDRWTFERSDRDIHQQQQQQQQYAPQRPPQQRPSSRKQTKQSYLKGPRYRQKTHRRGNGTNQLRKNEQEEDIPRSNSIPVSVFATNDEDAIATRNYVHLARLWKSDASLMLTPQEELDLIEMEYAAAAASHKGNSSSSSSSSSSNNNNSNNKSNCSSSNSKGGMIQMNYADGSYFEGYPDTSKRTKALIKGTYYDDDDDDDSQHQCWRGRMTYPDGSVYVGSWVNGSRHGVGRCFFKDGSFFKGEFQNGKYNGQGVMMWSDGGYYVGEWCDNEMHGNGIEIRADGTERHIGQWRHGRPVRK